MMTKTTFSESTIQKDREDARMIIRLQEEGKIKTVEDPETTGDLSEQFNLGKGEASAVALAGEENYVVMTDDKRGLKAARANNINRSTAISSIVFLSEEKIIEEEKARDALSVLEKEGRYDSYIIDDAERMISGGENR